VKKKLPAPESLLPLPPATFYILLALADGERHGYSIMKEVSESTGGAVRLGPGTLYGAIKRLLASGVVAETEHAAGDDDERRRYYRLTSHGVAVARAEARRLGGMVRAAQARRLIGAKLA
jgi:DNA-binding PadR family transcriptional regulator